jgi:hypothetical protein
MLTDDNLLVERDSGVSGTQRIYRFKNGMGLSLVNGPMLHSYPFAWEAAVLEGVREDGGFDRLSYSTPLTKDVEVFESEDEANEFIQRAAQLFNAD